MIKMVETLCYGTRTLIHYMVEDVPICRAGLLIRTNKALAKIPLRSFKTCILSKRRFYQCPSRKCLRRRTNLLWLRGIQKVKECRVDEAEALVPLVLYWVKTKEEF